MPRQFISSHNVIPYRKGIFNEYSEYNSLTILEMTKKDRDYALKLMLKLNTGNDAKNLAQTSVVNGKQVESKVVNLWNYAIVDLHGRIGVLKYKGVDIAVFIKRQITPHRINHEAPVSELKLNNEDDAWIRVDLSGLSARQSKKPTIDHIRKLEKDKESLEKKLAIKEAIVDQLEATVKRYEKKKKGRKAKSRTKDSKATKGRDSKVKLRHRKRRR